MKPNDFSNGKQIYKMHSKRNLYKEKKRSSPEHKPKKIDLHYNYYFDNLISNTILELSEIGGPTQERKIIAELTSHNQSIEMASNGYIPLSNRAVTQVIGQTGHEVDLLQDALLINHGRIVTFRFEVKNKQVGNSRKIIEQLTNISGLYPVWVERVSVNMVGSRHDWLLDRVGDNSYGFMFYTPKGFMNNFRLDDIEVNPRIKEFDETSMIIAYSLFSNLRLDGLSQKVSIENEMLFCDSFSVSNNYLNDQNNIVISSDKARALKSFYQNLDSLLIIDPSSPRVITGFYSKNAEFSYLFKNFLTEKSI